MLGEGLLKHLEVVEVFVFLVRIELDLLQRNIASINRYKVKSGTVDGVHNLAQGSSGAALFDLGDA